MHQRVIIGHLRKRMNESFVLVKSRQMIERIVVAITEKGRSMDEIIRCRSLRMFHPESVVVFATEPQRSGGFGDGFRNPKLSAKLPTLTMLRVKALTRQAATLGGCPGDPHSEGGFACVGSDGWKGTRLETSAEPVMRWGGGVEVEIRWLGYLPLRKRWESVTTAAAHRYARRCRAGKRILTGFECVSYSGSTRDLVTNTSMYIILNSHSSRPALDGYFPVPRDIN